MTSLKRVAILSLIGLLLFALVACGNSTPTPTKTPDPNASEDPEVTDTDGTDSDDAELPSVAGEGTFAAQLWSATIPEELVLNTDNAKDEEKSASHKFEYRADPESDTITATYSVSVSIVDHTRDFRRVVGPSVQKMRNYVDGVGTVEIGGLKFFVRERMDWGTPSTVYTSRDEAASADVVITISNKPDEAMTKIFLDSFKLTAPDIGHVDVPWPWDGERYVPTPTPVMAGAFTLTPEYLPIDEPVVLSSIMKTSIAVTNDGIYSVTDDEMRLFTFNGTGGLTLSREEVLDQTYEFVSCDNAGKLYLSPGIWELAIFQGFDKVFQSSVKHDLAIHPSGTWGISFWVNSDPMKVTVGDGVMSDEPWVLTNINKDAERQGAFSMISEVEVNENHIIVAGSNVNTGGETITIYSHAGEELFNLANTKSDKTGLGHITGIVETANGFLATDGNMRDIHIWNKEGAYIGTYDAKKLLSANYCWLESMQLLDDGSIILAISQRRDDASGDELVFFRLTGF